jgi:deazaflavin-dependent oxidoreductase (nitroreductase family)
MTATVTPPPDPGTPERTSPEPPALAAPPAVSPTFQAISDASRTAFKYGNRYGMVPVHRAGLAAWLGSPLTGWQCLVTTTGRRSGLPRHTPLGYMVADGAAWVMAGYGPATLWYRNLLDDPRVTLLLPGRPPIAALATEVRDPSVRARIIPALARSMALPGALIGCFPPTATDERILECVSFVPLVRITPADGSALLAGPDDPGGGGWAWRQALAVAVSWMFVPAAYLFASVGQLGAGFAPTLPLPLGFTLVVNV